MHFYFDRQHTTHHIRIVMQLLSTQTNNGHGDSAVQCPHKYARREGGCNWEWVYFQTEQQAREVVRWIHGGANDKFGLARADYYGPLEGMHAVHAHYDNSRRVPHHSAQ
jgi:hypothetical protein